MLSVLTLALAAASVSQASCPADVTVHGALTCSSSFAGTVAAAADSKLGGECSDSACYSCGEPFANENQVASEAVYSFECQLAGTVTMLITDLTCDLDIYVLDDSCDPYGGCLMGSTAPYDVDDSVEFECAPGQVYYVVVEAYGTAHLEDASGPCTDDGTATGTVYDPGYTLSFDVSASTGCAEDCDDGLDNDLDGDVDCDDSDCWVEDLCCDTDGDGYRAEGDCGGDDCDDTNPYVHPGAPEGDASGDGTGVDNDCDGTVDEGTNDYDDDGDGFTENDGDCDDGDASVNPDATDIPDNGIDEDCDDSDTTTPEDTQPPEDTDTSDTEPPESDDTGPVGDDTGDDDGKDGFGVCNCSAAPGGLLGGSLMGLFALGLAVRRRS